MASTEVNVRKVTDRAHILLQDMHIAVTPFRKRGQGLAAD